MMEFSASPVWFIALPLLAAFSSPLWVRLRLLDHLLFGVPLVLLILAFGLFSTVHEAPLIETIVIAPPLGIHLHLDSASLLLVTLFCFSVAMVAAFLRLGATESHLRGRQPFVLMLLLLAGGNGLVLTGDLFNLYVFLEIAGVSAYVLSALRDDRPALAAGLKYLIIGSVAGLFFLLAVVLVYLQTGQLNMAAIARDFATIPAAMQILIGLLVLIGLGIKSELFPFNFWVPDVYRGSDPAVTALFSGLLVKAFLFVLVHLAVLIWVDPSVARVWLMTLGALTLIVAELAALRQEDMRRMLAYSSLGQIGLIMLAFGFFSETTAAGAFFHLISHTLAKLLLFLVAALLLRRVLSLQLAALTGAGRAYPLTAGLFVLGALCILGLPPLSGFMSKLWILQGFAEARTFWPIALILVAALIEAGYYFRWIRALYAPVDPAAPTDFKVAADGWAVQTPLLVLAGLMLLLGVAPFVIEGALVDAARALLDRDLMLQSVLGAAS
jgi:multicomponent Na+:H+ antiporter subunit D